MADRKIFLIGIGGTGMRCLESFVHTCAIGMYDNTEVHMLALDTDKNNGNYDRLRRLVNCYKSVNGGNEKENTFFSAKLNYYEFSPEYTNQSFEKISNYVSASSHRAESPVADLVDLFVDEDVRKMNLEHGYRAQTQMGSMLMYYAILKAAYEKEFEKKDCSLIRFLDALGSDAKQPVFVFGSVFGGTGASSIPVIPLAFKSLKNTLHKPNLGDLRFGTMVLTNYFNFKKPDVADGEVVAKSENFAVNSQAALMFYNEDKTINNTYNRMYLLGRSVQRDVTVEQNKKGNTGGKEQENPADYIELLAASAAYHFFKEADKDKEAFDSDDDKGFFCISHSYDTDKLEFPLFGQEYSDELMRKFGVAVAASLLDVNYEFFKNIADTPNMFDLVKVDGEAFQNMKSYWGLFNYSIKQDGTLQAGWLPQMYKGRGGKGILFKELMFACEDRKSLGKFKFNKELFYGDNPPQFSVGLLSDPFNEVKKAFTNVHIDQKSSLDDLLSRTYATLHKLYFNE